MTATPDGRPFRAVSPEVAQAEVAALRRAVLGGRGPGAATPEVLRHTRARVTVGGQPVPDLRERVARDAAAARRDPDALLEHLVADRTRVAAHLRAVVPELRPQRLARRARRSPRLRRTGVVAGLLAVLVVVRRVARWPR